MAPSLRLMQRIIDAQPEGSAGNWSDIAGAGGVGGGSLGGARNSGGVARKDEILETLDRDFDLLALLVDVSFVGTYRFPSVFVEAVGLFSCLAEPRTHRTDQIRSDQIRSTQIISPFHPSDISN